MDKKLIIGVDTGGTFTDIVVVSDRGEVTTAKADTTPKDFSIGVMNAISGAATKVGLSPGELLASTVMIKHGSTVATNALINRSGAKVGLITTKGFEDTPLIMRAIGRVDGLPAEEVRRVMRVTKPEPMAPKSLIRGVSERISHRGNVVVPLDLEEVERAIRDLVETEGVKAIAVSLLHSWANPVHELKIKQVCQQLYDGNGPFVTLGSELSRVIGEYARTNTAIMNGYLGPVVDRYLGDLETKLRAEEFRGTFLVMQGNGGVAQRSQLTPIANVQSGPAGGVIGSAFMASLLGHKNVITTDMGGTSFDVSLITGGLWAYAEEPIVERFRVLQPLISVESIGAGGGTICRVEEITGRLLVGPSSAGADPGPICYDAGGTEVTVSDADAVLGILNPEYFAGGARRLNVEKARAAIKQKIARPLGIDAIEAAAGIYDLVNSKMSDLIRGQVTQQGYLPQEFVLYAFGGAGPPHAAGFAHDLGVPRLYVFPTSPVFSAFGCGAADVMHTHTRTCQYAMPVAPQTLNGILDAIEGELGGIMVSEGFPRGQVSFRRFLIMRFRRQTQGIEVAIPWDRFSPERVPELQNLFTAKYEELYGKGSGYSRGGSEVVGIRVDAVGTVVKPALNPVPYSSASPSSALKGTRKVIFTRPRLQTLTTNIYEYDLLKHGNIVEGPAIVESPFTTVVVPPHTRAVVDPYLNLALEIG